MCLELALCFFEIPGSLTLTEVFCCGKVHFGVCFSVSWFIAEAKALAASHRCLKGMDISNELKMAQVPRDVVSRHLRT